MKTEQAKPKEKRYRHNIAYYLRLTWRADKGLIIYSMIKNPLEGLFYVYFFVWMTKYIYRCLEEPANSKIWIFQYDDPLYNLLGMVLLGCAGHVVIHLVSAGHAYYLKRHEPLAYRRIFSEVMDKAAGLELSRFEQPEFFDKFSRALDEACTRAVELTLTLSWFVQCIIGAIGATWVLVTIDWRLIWLLLPAAVGSLLLGKFSASLVYQADKKTTRDRRVAEYVKRVFYEKKYAGELRLFPIAGLLLRRQRESVSRAYKTTRRYRTGAFFLDYLSILLTSWLTVFGCLLLCALAVKQQGAQPALYIVAINAVSGAAHSVRRAVEYAIEMSEHKLFIGNFREFFDLASSDLSGEKKLEEPIGSIEFDNVSFTYEGASEPTIKGLSFCIKKGEHIALVGHNGAGKTTIVKLLTRLYEPTGGRILVNGHDVREYTAASLREHFGAVFQDHQIFALSVAENVLMRTPRGEEDRRRVVDALEKAQFADKLAELPKGIDTQVTREFDEEGAVLSGGQAQKLAVARVFAKDAEVAVLDEPSSALDPIAEFNMYENMRELSRDRTVIFISHRLSSTRTADRICLLSGGRLTAEGTHDELMAAGGEYAEMFRLQAQNYQDAPQYSQAGGDAQ